MEGIIATIPGIHNAKTFLTNTIGVIYPIYIYIYLFKCFLFKKV